MKRDMDLIRLLLLECERSEPVDLSGYPEDARVYHASLCVDAGLVEGVVRRNVNRFPAHVSMIHLTWSGHDFLDAARSETVWKKAKGAIQKNGGAWTFDTLKALLVKIVTEAI